MSKSFEECYKEELLQELPDLWSRIEAGIEAGKTKETKTVKEAGLAGGAQEIKRKPKKNRVWIYLTPALAACVVGVIAIPALYFNAAMKASDSAPTEATSDFAGFESMEITNEAADSEYLGNYNITADAETDKYAMDENVTQTAGDGLDASGFLVEIVGLSAEGVTFRILEENISAIVSEYGLQEVETELFAGVCETESAVQPKAGMRYYVSFVSDGEKTYINLIKEYQE